nr:MAG TPA: hypothetical protein [Caudoviricetes sp.]
MPKDIIAFMNTKTAGHRAPLRKPTGVNQDCNTL